MPSETRMMPLYSRVICNFSDQETLLERTNVEQAQNYALNSSAYRPFGETATTKHHGKKTMLPKQIAQCH